MLGNWFVVRVAKTRPHQAAVAVKYRRHWFYIDDRDPASKPTFLLLRRILALKVQAGGAEALPILRLPIGVRVSWIGDLVDNRACQAVIRNKIRSFVIHGRQACLAGIIHEC